MNKLNEDLFYNLKGVSPKLLEESSVFEKNELDVDSKEKSAKLANNIDKITEKDASEIIELMSNMDISTMTNFILNVEKVDKKFAYALIKIIGHRKDDENALFVSEKLLRVYRMNLFSSVFSLKRIQALELALRKI